MKKKFLLSGLIFWIIITAALGALLIAGANGSLGFPAIFGGIGAYFSFDLVKQESVGADGIEEISLDCEGYDIKIIITDGNDIVVRQYDRNDKNPYKLAVRNGAFDLSFSTRIYIGISFGIPRIEIEIPESYAGGVTVATSSGSIKCTDYVNWSDIILSASSGSIRFEEEISCAKLSVKASSGTIRLSDVIADSAAFSSSSGSIRLGNVTADAVQVSSSSGTQHLGDIICKTFSSKATSGSVYAGDISASRTLGLKTSSGSLKAEAITADFFDLEATSGSVAVLSLCGGGNIKTSSGNIKLEEALFTADTSIAARSGSVKITLFDPSNISLDLGSSSGALKVENSGAYPSGRMQKQAYCIVGDGSDAAVKIRTSSGNITIY